MTYYEDHNKHWPGKVHAFLGVVAGAGMGGTRAAAVAEKLGIPYNRATAWISKYKRQGLLWCRYGNYGLTAKGVARLRFLRENMPATGG